MSTNSWSQGPKPDRSGPPNDSPMSASPKSPSPGSPSPKSKGPEGTVSSPKERSGGVHCNISVLGDCSTMDQARLWSLRRLWLLELLWPEEVQGVEDSSGSGGVLRRVHRCRLRWPLQGSGEAGYSQGIPWV